MRKFGRGSRVILTVDGRKHRGRVTRELSGKRGVVTDSGKRVTVSVKKLRRSPDRVLLLETRLDRNLKSDRSYGPMMKQWLSAYEIDVLYERVHTVESLRRFLQREGARVETRFIHIMGHGTDEPGEGTATLNLTFENLDLVKRADVFEGLKGKVIIFSCCEIGGDRSAMEAIKKASSAKAIIAYRKWVYDSQTNLCEVLLYDRLIDSTMSPKQIVDSVGQALKDLGIRVGPKGTRKNVLVCV